MKVLIFGATGMVGQGVLRACLEAPDVEQVLVVGRKATGQQHPKLRELVQAELLAVAAIGAQLAGFDACFFCVGLTTTRVGEREYTRVTHDITLAVASVLAEVSPDMSFVYLSGPQAREGSTMMQPRVRARTEEGLRCLPFHRPVVIMRPEMIVPVNGDRPRTPALRLFYALMKPVLSGLRLIAPHHILTTRQIGRAMLAVARKAPASAVLGGAAILALAR